MKRKLALLLVLALSVSTVLTGCKKEDSGEVNSTESPQYLQTTATVDYNKGDVINVADLVTVDSSIGDIAQIVATNEFGEVLTELDTSTEGSYLVNIIVQTATGEEHSVEYMYNVVSDVLANGCTKEIYDKISNMNHIVYPTEDNTCITLAIPEGWSTTNGAGSVEVSGVKVGTLAELIDKDYNSARINYYYVSPEEALNALYTYYELATSLILFSGSEDNESLNNITEEQQAKYMENISAFTRELFAMEVEDAGFKLYGLDGTEYNVKQITTICNMSMLKAGEAKYPVGYTYLIELPNSCITLDTVLGVDKVIVKGVDVTSLTLKADSSITINGVDITTQDLIDAGATQDASGDYGFGNQESLKINEDIVFDVVTIEDLESVDTIKNFFNKQFEKAPEGPMSITPSTDDELQTKELASNIYIGEFKSLENIDTPTEQPSEEPTEQETETQQEQESEQEIPTEEPDKNKEESDSVKNTATTYKSKYPAIFDLKWNTAIKYRRWVYNIEIESFQGSIIKPDGTIIEGEGEVDIREPGSGGGGSTTDDTPSTPNADVYTLTSNYANYEISNKEISEVEFMTADSTSNKLVVKHKDQLYYLELAKSSKINSYKTNCVYPTTTFKDGVFEIITGDTKTVSIGKITEYKIKYTDYSGNQNERPYMSVLMTDSDYIVCYGANIIDVNDSVLTTFIEKMVTKN